MRFSPIKFLHGLLYTVPVLFLTLAACGGGGGTSGGTLTTVTAPAAPTGVSATDASVCYYRIAISWSAATGATGYNLYRSAASGVVATASNKITVAPVTASPYIDSGVAVTSSSKFYYIVTAVNSAGESVASAEVNATAAGALGVCTKRGGSIQVNPLALSGTVTTLAGKSGLPGATDATGISAQFNGPNGIATDGTNIYVADTANNVIRKIVISSGAVTTVAGSGAASSVDAPGTLASFNGPKGITTDGTNLYVADTGNNTIRKIDSSGAVSTVAGSGAIGSTDNLTGTLATFHLPSGITSDGTNLYVADTANHLIRKIVLASPFAVTTVAGTGTAGSFDALGTSASFSSPIGITSDGTNLYVADTANHLIRKIVLTSPFAVTTVAGSAGVSGITDGTTAARFNFPQGITTDGTNLYVADRANHLIRKISGAAVSTVAGTVVAGVGTAGSADGTGANASFSSPIGITTDGTYLYDADSGTSTIRRIQ
jgi:sugar lactone lactonase YvrE